MHFYFLKHQNHVYFSDNQQQLKELHQFAPTCSFIFGSLYDKENIAPYVEDLEFVYLFILSSHIECQFLKIICEISWPEFGLLSLSCIIDERHCQILTKTKWQVKHLSISMTSIEMKPFCEKVLSKWKAIKSFSVINVLIMDWKLLFKVDLPNLSCFESNCSSIQVQNFHEMASTDWKNLTQINLFSSKLNVMSIRYLIRGNLNKIKILNFSHQTFSGEQLRQLIKGELNELQSLSISQNTINPDDFKHLKKANWKKLRRLCIQYWNSSIDCRPITAICFINTERSLKLQVNRLACHLQQAQWPTVLKNRGFYM